MALFEDSSAWIVLCAMLVAIVILLRRSFRYFGRRKGREPPIVHVPRPEDSPHGLPSDASSELVRQEVQLYERERDVSARLDSKMGVLQHLIHQAQNEITRLEAVITQTKQIGTGEAGAPDIGTLVSAPPPSVDPMASGAHNAAIYALADQGMSAVTIAHHVGMPLDKIEAILGERKKT